MRSISALLLSLLVLGSLGSQLLADSPATPASPAVDAPASSKSGKGTVRKIDTAKNTIEVRITDAQGKNATTLVLTVTSTTKITRNKKSATISDLKPGDQVQFTYTGSTDPSAGTALTVNAKAKSKKATTPPPATTPPATN
jgi:Cu/Ag efflux protein CusF